MIQRIGSCFFLLFCITISTFCQTKSDAEEFFNSGDFNNAKKIYKQLLEKKSKDGLLNFCYARTLFELKDSDAESYFEMALKNGFLKSYFYLGELFFHDYRFAKARESYLLFLDTNPSEKELISFCEKRIKQCETGEDFIKRVDDITLIDSLVVEKKGFLAFYRLPSESGKIATQNPLDSTTSYTTERRDRIFYSEKKEGQLDLFYTYKLLEEWSSPLAFSETINTVSDENYPFLLADGVTLYFASNRPESLGGYDIYMTRFSSQTNDYLPPQNIGMPFNSLWNDYLLAIDEVSNIGWFATDRYQHKDSVCIYRFVPNSEKKILKDIDEESLIREYAKLKRYKKREELLPTKIEEEIPLPIQKITFQVTDEIAYFSLSDFKNEENVGRFLKLQQLEKEIFEIKDTLKIKRAEYALTELPSREILEKEILTLEKEQQRVLSQIKKITQEIRQSEAKLNEEK